MMKRNKAVATVFSRIQQATTPKIEHCKEKQLITWSIVQMKNSECGVPNLEGGGSLTYSRSRVPLIDSFVTQRYQILIHALQPFFRSPVNPLFVQHLSKILSHHF